MNRRAFLLFAGSAATLAFSPRAALAQRFEPARFSVETLGHGPDLLLIPGLTSGRHVWRATADAVPGYRYHLIQVSGFAGEPARGNARGPVVSPLADEIIRYIEGRGLRRPAIVGHSMGGTLAMMIAARRPDLVGRIMVVDMLPQPAGLFGSNAAGAAPIAEGLQRMMASPQGRQAFGSLMSAFSPPNSRNSRSDADVVGRALNELARTDLTPQLPRIRAPLTIVYASPSERLRASLERVYARAYATARHARLVRIDDSGHMVMLDQPARFRAALREFLTS